MKFKTMLAAVLLGSSLLVVSCGGKEKKKEDTKTGELSIGPAKQLDNDVPKIDTGNLKDEASIISAMQTFVDAQVALDKKIKDNPSADSHFVEMTKIQTAIMNAATNFSQTFKDPAKSVEFLDKISNIQKKLYEK